MRTTGESVRNARRECSQQARVRTVKMRMRTTKAREAQQNREGVQDGLVGGAAGGAYEVQLCVLLGLMQRFGAGDGAGYGVRESDPEIGGQ
jgi:hypothetical protein